MTPLEDPRDRRRTAAPTTPAPVMPGSAKGGAEGGSHRADRRAQPRHGHLGVSAQEMCLSRRAVVVAVVVAGAVLQERLMRLLSLVWLRLLMLGGRG